MAPDRSLVRYYMYIKRGGILRSINEMFGFFSCLLQCIIRSNQTPGSMFAMQLILQGSTKKYMQRVLLFFLPPTVYFSTNSTGFFLPPMPFYSPVLFRTVWSPWSCRKSEQSNPFWAILQVSCETC